MYTLRYMYMGMVDQYIARDVNMQLVATAECNKI